MVRTLLIADDEARWPVAARPPVVLTRSDRFLKLQMGTVSDYRALLREVQPEVIHADGPTAVRVAYLLTRFALSQQSPKILVSGAAVPNGGVTGWLTRRGLCNADCVVARSVAEAEVYRSLGVADARITRIPFGVAPSLPPDPTTFRRSLDIPKASRLVIAAGRFDSASAMKTAVWAFDVLKYAAPDLYLVLIGDGPERERLARFAKALGFDDYRVRFAGARDDTPALFGLAEVVWVTHERGGVELALAAMATGRPVVAAKTPDLAEVIEDGVTGRLVDATDRVRLAAITNELLENPDLASRLGATARARVLEQFPAPAVGERFAGAYRVSASR
jgi:glycosyltransferase involved in cell wall biosynthesis